MNLTLHLSPETENKLKAQASLTGRSLESLVLEALQEKLSVAAEADDSLSPASRLAEFQAWLVSHPASSAGVVDDSRESVYSDRGE